MARKDTLLPMNGHNPMARKDTLLPMNGHNPRYGSKVGRSAYIAGCRCDGCRKAANAYARDRRARLRQTQGLSAAEVWEGPESPGGSPEPEPVGSDCNACGLPLYWTQGRTGQICEDGHWTLPEDTAARAAASQAIEIRETQRAVSVQPDLESQMKGRIQMRVNQAQAIREIDRLTEYVEDVIGTDNQSIITRAYGLLDGLRALKAEYSGAMDMESYAAAERVRSELFYLIEQSRAEYDAALRWYDKQIEESRERPAITSAESQERRSAYHEDDGDDYADDYYADASESNSVLMSTALPLGSYGGMAAAGIRVAARRDLLRQRNGICAYKHSFTTQPIAYKQLWVKDMMNPYGNYAAEEVRVCTSNKHVNSAASYLEAKYPNQEIYVTDLDVV